MTEDITYKWNPIEDLPPNWEEYVDEGLSHLSGIWEEQKRNLRNLSSIKKFNERLQRQWAIETGIIENLYTLDRGITLTLVEKGIQASLIPHGKTNKPVEYVVDLMQDQEKVVESLFRFVGGTRQLTCSYIKEIHAALTQHQTNVDAVDMTGKPTKIDLIRGDWKRLPNNPTRTNGSIHEYCPPEQVASEMDRLVEMHGSHCISNVPPEIEAAWLHHRFTQIHPFQDGNGRVARSLATLVFLRAGWLPLVIISDEHRTEYIFALEEADRGNLRKLIVLFARLEQKAFFQALSIGEQVIAQRQNFEAMLDTLVDSFSLRTEDLEKEQKKVIPLADDLIQIGREFLHRKAGEMEQKFKPFSEDISISSDYAQENTKRWFWNQVITIASKFEFKYYANLRNYHNWIRLTIREARRAGIVISIHPIGTEFNGLMGATAFLEYRDRQEEGPSEIDGPYPLVDSPFYFTYKEQDEQVKERFRTWLDEVLLKGLEEWRQRL
ncbi:MAG: Fic family protein [Sedimentisphaerales bacterium]|nr:Fic family protein [Sedimentisphaerales bacterium]